MPDQGLSLDLAEHVSDPDGIEIEVLPEQRGLCGGNPPCKEPESIK